MSIAPYVTHRGRAGRIRVRGSVHAEGGATDARMHPEDRRAHAQAHHHRPVRGRRGSDRGRRFGREVTVGRLVHLVNPSNDSFGVAVITPRWLFVLAAAAGTRWGDPHLVDETLDPIDLTTIAAGDVVGIGIHTGNALRGYEV